MDDDAVQLFIIILAELLGIGAYRIKRDHQVTIQRITFTIVEGDDICVVVVPQVFIIHLKDLLVVAEKIAYLAHLLTIRGCHGTNPCGGLSPLDLRHLHAFYTICNHKR